MGAKICDTLADAVAMTASTTANASTAIGRREDWRRMGMRKPKRGAWAGASVTRLYAASASNVVAGTARSRAAWVASADVLAYRSWHSLQEAKCSRSVPVTAFGSSNMRRSAPSLR